MREPTRGGLLDHSYDGIQEFDNPTPGWWWWLFNGTVFFSFCYLLFFFGNRDTWTLQTEYDKTMAADLRKQFAEIGELKPDEATLLKYMNEPKWLTVGRLVFQGNCVSCHSANAAGGVGPNLTDDFYKNVKKITDVPQVVTNGAANGAMPAWKNRLHPNEIVLVACYVASLRGQNVPGPRGTEGELIPPWPKTPAGK